MFKPEPKSYNKSETKTWQASFLPPHLSMIKLIIKKKRHKLGVHKLLFLNIIHYLLEQDRQRPPLRISADSWSKHLDHHMDCRILFRITLDHYMCRGFVETDATWVAYVRCLTMTILEHLDKIGTRHDVPRFGPSRWRYKPTFCLIVFIVEMLSFFIWAHNRFQKFLKNLKAHVCEPIWNVAQVFSCTKARGGS
jgi:hypothetical protein